MRASISRDDNQALRLRYRKLARLHPRAVRLLPICERTLTLWICGARDWDSKYVAEVNMAIDSILAILTALKIKSDQ